MNNEHYQTKDIRLASALIAIGFPVTSISKENDKVTMYFQREGTLLDQAISRYWMKTLLVDAQSLLIEHQILKQRITNL